jgi:alkylhydroperoxidase family enzyme
VWFLQLQGEEYSELGAALRDGRLDDLPVTEAERLLLDYVGTVTRHAWRVSDAQVEQLREAGWTDEQIAEATYDAALFNLFVRLADAFDIHPFPAFDPDGVQRAVVEGPRE